MHFNIFHSCGIPAGEKDKIRTLLTSKPAGSLVLGMLLDQKSFCRQKRVVLPAIWNSDRVHQKKEIVSYENENPFSAALMTPDANSDVVLSDARRLTLLDPAWIQQKIRNLCWDAVSVRVDPLLDVMNEKISLTPDSRVAGIRRCYSPAIEPDTPPAEWPHLLIIKNRLWKEYLNSSPGPEIKDLIGFCRNMGYTFRSLRIGGQSAELLSDIGLGRLLEFSRTAANFDDGSTHFADHVRIAGKIHCGRDVKIGSGTVLTGPVIICDGAQIGSKAVISGALIGPDAKINDCSQIRSSIIFDSETGKEPNQAALHSSTWRLLHPRKVFRTWPLFSYARVGKRIFDLLASTLILILFMPFFPIIAFLVKISSPGPVLYRARRQGRHGKEFECLKFRTMMAHAEDIQESLRIANQVDGPQFKIEDDPRISGIGKFLRDTCLDELPQFINVLLGQMSMVGPRPSPEVENEACPQWRDARLSVRPGITGLWQVCRTRRAGMDFQEWIYYDTMYVRRLSFGMDLMICLKTVKKLVISFLDQFG